MLKFTRRDFLKAAGAVAVSALAPWELAGFAQSSTRPNIIIILCDSLSARHMSLHGYVRDTTPNIDAFAERSTVFHNHYSGGNYTTPGTASMLTGMIPWKHRALNLGGLVRSEYIGSNPYTLLGDEYYRLAFSQNSWPDRLVGQYHNDVDRFLSPTSYSVQEDVSVQSLFHNDRSLATIAIEDFLLPVEGVVDQLPMGSSVIGYIHQSQKLNSVSKENFPAYSKSKAVPRVESTQNSYLNEVIYRGVHSELSRLAAEHSPYFAYFHLYSPHYPYRPRNDFRQLFQKDGYVPVTKPMHPLGPGIDQTYLNSQSGLYDKQIAQVDDEFGRLIAKLEKEGTLNNSYLIFTSDHGELFERGFIAHGDVFMYEPVLHIPLLIHAPGQTNRQDVHSLTSNIDLLPTILAIAGKSPSPDADGQVLPGFGGEADEDRSVISLYGGQNSAFGPLKKAVLSMRKGQYKLIGYLGYEHFDHVYEFYDLEQDPDELDNLVSKDPSVFAAMKDELLTRLDEANQAFE